MLENMNKKLLHWLSKLNNQALSLALMFNIANFSAGAVLGANFASLEAVNLEPLIQATSFIGENTLLGSKRLTVTITAYSSTPDQTDDTPFITASNTHVRDGIVAANFLPFGAKIMIPEFFGDKIFVVEDRMHRRFSDRVDIWFETRWQAKQFGKREAEIIILAS